MSAPLKQFFFITGLPRSRSAWLANFFTWGKAFCLHDAMTKGAYCRAVIDQLLPLRCAYAGDADSALCLVAPEMQRLLPDAKWLLVRRDRADAQESFARFFGGRPYPRTPMDKRTLCAVFDHCVAAYERTRSSLRPGSFIEIPFEELDSKLALEEAWRFLTPGNAWSAPRCDMLQQLETNVRPEKVNQADIWSLCPPRSL